MTANRIVFVLLFGFVLIYLPARLFSVVDWPASIGISQVAGIVICATGAAIALWCVSGFAFIGRGTPAPFAAPRRLVTRGPYRIVRNPMYIGVGMFSVGAAVFYQSLLVLAYAALFFVSSHWFVVLYEEPTLRRTFGDEYTSYCGRVRRWAPRFSSSPNWDRTRWRTTFKVIGYWTATTLIGLETLAGGATDLARGRTMLVSGPFVIDIITHLGYPAYILAIFGVWKVLGGIVLFAPGLPRLKEWVYAGVIFELTGAAASFAAHSDPVHELIGPLVLASLALASWALRPPSRRLGVIFRGERHLHSAA